MSTYERSVEQGELVPIPVEPDVVGLDRTGSSSRRLHYASLRLHSSLRLHYVFIISSLHLHHVFTTYSLHLRNIFTTYSLQLRYGFGLYTTSSRSSYSSVTQMRQPGDEWVTLEGRLMLWYRTRTVISIYVEFLVGVFVVWLYIYCFYFRDILFEIRINSLKFANLPVSVSRSPLSRPDLPVAPLYRATGFFRH